ncbi:trimethylamine methyltransferase family protein [Mesorhizobium sp. M1169]
MKQRALEHTRHLLAEYEEPKLDVAKDEELRAYVDRRSRDIPVDALNEEY